MIFIIIIDGKKWHYLSVKRLSGLLNKIRCNHEGGFYCLNFFHSLRAENALKKHENLCKNHGYCYVEIPDKDNKYKYNSGEKYMRVPFIFYVDMECFLENIST